LCKRSPIRVLRCL
nr:immunoglobulin heavy chain junction region [Mus musculus]